MRYKRVYFNESYIRWCYEEDLPTLQEESLLLKPVMVVESDQDTVYIIIPMINPYLIQLFKIINNIPYIRIMGIKKDYSTYKLSKNSLKPYSNIFYLYSPGSKDKYKKMLQIRGDDTLNKVHSCKLCKKYIEFLHGSCSCNTIGCAIEIPTIEKENEIFSLISIENNVYSIEKI